MPFTKGNVRLHLGSICLRILVKTKLLVVEIRILCLKMAASSS